MRGALRVGSHDLDVFRIHRRAFNRALEQPFGIAHEVLVQRAVERDVDSQRAFTPAPRPPRLLHQRRDGAREPEVQGAVEVPNVHAQLEGVGRRDAAKGAAEERTLHRAPVLRRVPSSVRRDGVREVPRAGIAQNLPAVPEDQLAQFFRLAERDALEVVADAFGEERGDLDDGRGPRRLGPDAGDDRGGGGVLVGAAGPRLGAHRRSRRGTGVVPRILPGFIAVTRAEPRGHRSLTAGLRSLSLFLCRLDPLGHDRLPHRWVPHQKRLVPRRGSVLVDDLPLCPAKRMIRFLSAGANGVLVLDRGHVPDQRHRVLARVRDRGAGHDEPRVHAVQLPGDPP